MLTIFDDTYFLYPLSNHLKQELIMCLHFFLHRGYMFVNVEYWKFSFK